MVEITKSLSYVQYDHFSYMQFEQSSTQLFRTLTGIVPRGKSYGDDKLLPSFQNPPPQKTVWDGCEMDTNQHCIGGGEGEVKKMPIFCDKDVVPQDFCPRL